jgi:hypothetical protein
MSGLTEIAASALFGTSDEISTFISGIVGAIIVGVILLFLSPFLLNLFTDAKSRFLQLAMVQGWDFNSKQNVSLLQV